MGSEVFVDVTYRGLELGRRLKLREVGPNTAYLEHGTPMPVGSQVVLATDDGLSIPVLVVRVHEQVAGAEMPPGMRVQAAGLEGAAATWWRDLVSREDPQIPEPETYLAAPTRRAEPPPPQQLPPNEEAPVVEMEADEPDDDRPTTLMTAVEPPEDTAPGAEHPSKGNGKLDNGNPSRTTVMSAQEIREALGTDPSAPAPTDSPADEGASGNGETGADERSRTHKTRRRRRRR